MRVKKSLPAYTGTVISNKKEVISSGVLMCVDIRNDSLSLTFIFFLLLNDEKEENKIRLTTEFTEKNGRFLVHGLFVCVRFRSQDFD